MDDKPRRARTHADDADRANVGRHHRSTPRGGVPLEVDPELTPPPQLPPVPDRDDPAARLDRLELAAEQLSAGMERVWPSRHDDESFSRFEHAIHRQGERLDKLIEAQIQTQALVEQFVLPALKGAQGRIDLLLSFHESNKTRVAVFWEHEWPAAVESLKGMSERLGRLERIQEDQGRDLRAVGAEVKSALAIGNSLDVRITALEQRTRTDDIADEKITAVTIATKNRDKWWLGALITAGGFIGAAAKALFDYLAAHH